MLLFIAPNKPQRYWAAWWRGLEVFVLKHLLLADKKLSNRWVEAGCFCFSAAVAAFNVIVVLIGLLLSQFTPYKINLN
jgi:hypothetical protein